MDDMERKMLSESLDSERFLCHRHSHPQETIDLTEKILEMVEDHKMSVSAARGFFDYMKAVVGKRSRVMKKV